MSSIPLPPGLRVNGFSMQPAAVTRAHSSPFGGDGAEAVVDLLQDRWRASFSTTATTRAESGAIEAWLAAQRGGANTTPLHHFARPYPLGTLGRQHPVYGLLADAAQGAEEVQLATVPGATLLAGDMVGVSGLLLQCAADCVADGQGVITVPLVNRLRRALVGFRRASTGTFVDAAGVLQTAAAHVARYTYFSGKNIYSGPVDLVAASGSVGAFFDMKTPTSNQANLQPGEQVTVSADLFQDGVALAAGNEAQIYLETMNSIGVRTFFGYVNTVRTASGARLSFAFTLSSLASDFAVVRVGIYKTATPTVVGLIRADAIMVERGAVATVYEPGARLLVESAGTNLMPQSDNLSLWISNGATLSPTPVMAPDGSLSARVIPLVAGTMFQAIVSPVGQPVTVSQYIKPEPGASIVRLFVDGAGASGGIYVEYQVPGMVLAFATPGVSRSAIRREPNGWYRVDFSFTPIAGFAVHAYPLAVNQAFWRTQVEPGLVATSPIPTTTAPATRAADLMAPAIWNKPTRPFRLASRAGVRHVAGYAEGLALDFVEDLTP